MFFLYVFFLLLMHFHNFQIKIEQLLYQSLEPTLSIPDDQSTRKWKQETNLRSDRRPYLNGPTYDGPTYEGQAKCFSSRSLLGLPRLLNKCVTDQFILALARNKPVCIDFQPGKQKWGWFLPSFRCMGLPSLWCTRALSLQCALSL